VRDGKGAKMAGGYRISATPEIKDGNLQGVAFTAESAQGRHEWFTRNCGQFPVVFARVMPANVARVLLQSLEHGDAIEFPSRYNEEEFDRQFAFEWSPVHFLRPQQFAEPGGY
jgi:hypothetical protein